MSIVRTKHYRQPVAEALCRIAQESLHNVTRHAHATRVDVDLQCIDNRVILKIEDNGVGFDTTRARHGMGVGNMQERLLDVGGKLVIDSQPSIGTTVRAEVQLRPQHETLIPSTDSIQEQANPSQWLWLGEKLVIPVGQTWPWLPDDEERHLSEPIILPHTSPITIRKEKRLLAIRTQYTLRSADQRNPITKIYRERSGYTWDYDNATWDLQQFQGLYGRSVLLRNGQALAAMQYQGRQMNTWTEIVYRSLTFNLVYGQGTMDCYTLKDSQGHNYGNIHKSEMTFDINRPIPLPLLVIVVTRFLDESTVGHRVHSQNQSEN
ncbi:MAG: hypothetical protein E4H27_02910 [Anaerolineales bacterium]|nr:MAG: hypothetical protein E4H27_02910 [Anaerolineales bacterium]